MKVETRTSVYDLKFEPQTREFVLNEEKVKSGAFFRVSAGEEFRGDRVQITPQGLILYRGNKIVLSTSRLVSL